MTTYSWEFWAVNPPKYCRLVRIEDDGTQTTVLAPVGDALFLSEEDARMIVDALNRQ